MAVIPATRAPKPQRFLKICRAELLFTLAAEGRGNSVGSSHVDPLLQMDESMADAVSKVLASLRTTRNGVPVQILISQLDSLDEAMNSTMDMGGAVPDGN